MTWTKFGKRLRLAGSAMSKSHQTNINIKRTLSTVGMLTMGGLRFSSGSAFLDFGTMRGLMLRKIVMMRMLIGNMRRPHCTPTMRSCQVIFIEPGQTQKRGQWWWCEATNLAPANSTQINSWKQQHSFTAVFTAELCAIVCSLTSRNQLYIISVWILNIYPYNGKVWLTVTPTVDFKCRL